MFVEQIFDFLNHLKLYHWMTTSYSRHKAADECFTLIQSLSDKFVETFIGKYGRTKLVSSSFLPKIEIVRYTDSNIRDLFVDYIQFLRKLKLDPKSDSDLLNIVDEMVGSLNQTLYLFTLK
jgi:hypothetical protein